MLAANVKKSMSRVRRFWEWAEANFDDIPALALRALLLSLSATHKGKETLSQLVN